MNLRSRDNVVNNLQLAHRLCAESNDLRATHARHIAQHGNLIPHVFMGDVLARTRACIQWCGPNAESPDAELAGILAALERAMEGGDRETVGVIGISFLRDAEAEPFFAALKPMLGPRLCAMARR